MDCSDTASHSSRRKKKTSAADFKPLTDKQVEGLRDLFYCLDKDKTGFIVVKDINSGGVMDDMMVEEEELEDRKDETASKQIGIEEFIEGMKEKLVLRDTQDELRDAFMVFDKEGNGFIDAVELRRVMSGLGTLLTNEQIDVMLKESDLDGDGQVNYEEYIRILFAT